MEISEAESRARCKQPTRRTVWECEGQGENARSLNIKACSAECGEVGRLVLYFDKQNSDKHSFAWQTFRVALYMYNIFFPEITLSYNADVFKHVGIYRILKYMHNTYKIYFL